MVLLLKECVHVYMACMQSMSLHTFARGLRVHAFHIVADFIFSCQHCDDNTRTTWMPSAKVLVLVMLGELPARSYMLTSSMQKMPEMDRVALSSLYLVVEETFCTAPDNKS